MVKNLFEATALQSYWLQSMAAQDIQYKLNIEQYLIGIARGVGVKIEESSTSLRESNSFREQMKRKQKLNKEKKEHG